MTQPGRAERLRAARVRDGDTCIWCGCAFTDRTAVVTDHVIPRARGGPSWAGNEVAACRRCNGERGHRGAVEWLEECERGGQRLARPHLEAQLCRLHRRVQSAA